MTGPRRTRTDVWDKIKQQRDQPGAGAVEVDPWLNEVAQGSAPATQKSPWQSWRGTAASEWARRNASAAGPTSKHHGDGGQEVRGDEAKDTGRSRNDLRPNERRTGGSSDANQNDTRSHDQPTSEHGQSGKK